MNPEIKYTTTALGQVQAFLNAGCSRTLQTFRNPPGSLFRSGGAVAVLQRYPGYHGPLNVTGMFLLTAVGSSIAILGVMDGLQPVVHGGWHIHVGKTCEDASQVCFEQ